MGTSFLQLRCRKKPLSCPTVLRTEAAGCLETFVSTKLHGVTFQKAVVNVLCSCLFSLYKRKANTNSSNDHHVGHNA